MTRFTVIFIVLLSPLCAAAQDSVQQQQLEEVTVKAFEQKNTILRTAAALDHISTAQLQSPGNNSIVSAINTQPGVRMEERSPGSYRLNIRGSSLRAPFGVRNVKVYYNDIPLTDAGGTTYLNQLGYYNFASVDILKGPAGSIYGAGTGGVLLISSMTDQWQQGIKTEVTGGSFGLFQMMGEARFGTDKGIRNTVRYQHFQSDGYRQQSAMQKKVLSWDAVTAMNEQTKISAHFLYSDLQYQTPGALTRSEYDSAPEMARPRTGSSPGAADNKAAIYQKTFLAGFTVTQALSKHWSNTATLYGFYAQVYNPNIRNYSKTSEPNAGARNVLRYERAVAGGQANWIAGGEWQQNFSTVGTYSNQNGLPDTLQSDDILRTRLLLAFTQVSYEKNGWSFTTGLSVSNMRFLYARVSRPPYKEEVRSFNNQLSPRVALLKKWLPALVTYITVSKGFSPPAAAELSPSGGNLNRELNPEQGWNYETGLRGRLWSNRLYYDISAFWFALDRTIVQRRDASGGDYYINSGQTDQKGLEAAFSYSLLQKDKNNFGDVNLRGSYTWHHFRYKSFKQLDQDYSGNALPGVPPHTIAAGLEIRTRYAFSINASYYYNAAFALNDAGTENSSAFHLLGCKISYDLTFKTISCTLFTGGENLLDIRYSPGPDINAFGGRYYNAAPGRNFYTGLTLQYRQ